MFARNLVGVVHGRHSRAGQTRWDDGIAQPRKLQRRLQHASREAGRGLVYAIGLPVYSLVYVAVVGADHARFEQSSRFLGLRLVYKLRAPMSAVQLPGLCRCAGA